MIKEALKNILPPFVLAARSDAYRMRVAIEFYKQFLPDDCLVFDVGANLGDRVAIFNSLGARVVAFEPQSACAKKLNKRFKGNNRIEIVQCGLSDSEGELEMLLATKNKVSTLSSEFIESSIRSGRFKGIEWNKREVVKISTMDKEISRRGVPSFAKIDVEGYESKVLSGLSTPLNALSFEWTPERLSEAQGCIVRCADLGMNEFNLSLGESMQMNFTSWVSPKEIADLAGYLSQNVSLFGDIYARSPI